MADTSVIIVTPESIFPCRPESFIFGKLEVDRFFKSLIKSLNKDFKGTILLGALIGPCYHFFFP